MSTKKDTKIHKISQEYYRNFSEGEKNFKKLCQQQK